MPVSSLEGNATPDLNLDRVRTRTHAEAEFWVAQLTREVQRLRADRDASASDAAPASAPPAERTCGRAKSSMTPCVIRDGDDARADDGCCVGCGVELAR